MSVSVDGLSHEGIHDGQVRKSTEVAVCGPELADAVLHTECGDASVVDLGTGDLGNREHAPKLHPVLVGLSEQHERGGFEPRLDLVECQG